MNEVIGIKIPYLKQIQYLYTDTDYEVGTKVIINSGGGEFQCEISSTKEPKTMMHNIYKASKIIRVATEADELKYLQTLNENRKLAAIFKKGVRTLNLPVSFIGIWQSIDNKYIKIMYYSTKKINFREIIGFMLKFYNRKVRIEMVQVGNREYNALIGGYGVCGYELCCHNRHYTVPPITSETLRYIGYRIDIKEQLIGSCNKYKCCLLYEAEEYKSLLKHLPNYGAKIKYKNKIYSVVDINIFSKIITVAFKNERIDLPFSYFEKEKIDASDA